MTTTTILPFAGGELSSFDPQDSGCFEDTGGYDASVSRCDIFVSGGSGGFKSPQWAQASDFWFHGYCVANLSEGAGGILQLYDGATVVLQIDSTTPGAWDVKSLQGGVLTTVGTLLPAVGTVVLDIRLTAGASGAVEGYLSNTLIFRTTGLNHTGFGGVTQMQCRGPAGGFGWRWSQIICDSIAHVGNQLVTIAIDTASAVNVGWSGPVTNINEIVTNDANNVTSNAANQVSTYYKAAFSLGTYNVLGVFIGARAQTTAGGNSNIQIALRTNGSNYFSSTIALAFGMQACCWSWSNNPATGTAWLPSQAAVIEGGMQSIA